MASLVAFQPKVSTLHVVVHVALVLVGLVGWGHWTRSCVLEAFQRSSSVDVALPVLQVRCIHWAPPPPFFPEVGWVEEDEQEVFHSAEEGETRLRGQPGSEHLCTSRGRGAILQVRRRYLRGGFGEDLVLTCLGTPPSILTYSCTYPCCQSDHPFSINAPLAVWRKSCNAWKSLCNILQ